MSNKKRCFVVPIALSILAIACLAGVLIYKQLRTIDISDLVVINDLYCRKSNGRPFTGIGVAFFESHSHDGINEGKRILHKKRTFRNGKLNGPASDYGPDGSLCFKGQFKNNLADGMNYTYREDGTLEQVLSFKNALLHGPTIKYHPNGNVKAQGNYKDNLLDGKFITYYEDSTVSSIRHFDSGKMVGPMEVYSKNGERKLMTMLDLKAQSEPKVEDNGSSLILAVYYGDVEKVKSLLKNDAGANEKDGRGATPLIWAAYIGADVEMARILIENGADINATGGELGWSPLHWAAYNGDMKMVKYLIDNGANVNCSDRYGRTPICVAAIRNQIDVMNLLGP